MQSREKSVRIRSVEDNTVCRPVHVVWEITLACNLRCLHCGSRAGRPRPNELTTAEALALIRQLAELGTREISLIGGEAYLRRDWLQLIEAIASDGMRPSLQTGGRALTRAKIEAAAKAGLRSAGVSLDGLPERHDRLRGVPGSFNHAMAALEGFKDFGILSSVNTQISSGCFEDLRPLLHRIAAAGAKSWQIQLTVAMGNAVDNEALLLQPYEIPQLMDLLHDLYVEAAQLGVLIIPGNNIGYFGPYESQWRKHSNDDGHWQGCGAGKTTIGIEADGTIKGCPSLPTNHYAGGNIRDFPLRELWEKSDTIGVGRKATTDRLWGYCETCYYSEVCGAGCTWTTHVLFGRPGNNPYCHYRARDLQRKNLRERVRKVANGTGKPFDHGRFELVLETLDGEVTGVATGQEPLSSCIEKKISRKTENGVPPVLSPCGSCNEYRFSDDVDCPHCGVKGLPATPDDLQFYNSVMKKLAVSLHGSREKSP